MDCWVSKLELFQLDTWGFPTYLRSYQLLIALLLLEDHYQDCKWANRTLSPDGRLQIISSFLSYADFLDYALHLS